MPILTKICFKSTLHSNFSKEILINHPHLENRKEMVMKEEQPLKGSSRWNPTAEQLLALEEMYRRGTRTPTADQIQQIATQLRRFGKIEGKNVFYWFQNHKPRQRQKRRLEADPTFRFRHYHPPQTLHHKDLGLREVFKQKKTISVSSSNCTQNLEGHFSMQRAARNGDGEKMILQNHHKSSTWQAMDTYILMNNKNTTSSSRFLNSKWIKKKNEEAETLELFPLCSSEESTKEVNDSSINNIKDTKVAIRAINTKLNPHQYFEFLPLKK